MTRRRAQQDGPSLLDELDALDVTEAHPDAPVTTRPKQTRKPAPPVSATPDEANQILERVRAERERLDRAITAARHRIDRPPRCTLDHCSCPPNGDDRP